MAHASPAKRDYWVAPDLTEAIAVNNSPYVLLDDPAVEKRWGKKPGFMSDLRARGKGPRFLRLSARTVRYRPEDVLAYEEQQEFGSIAASMASNFTAPADPLEGSYEQRGSNEPATSQKSE
jgi:hypothetical protein